MNDKEILEQLKDNNGKTIVVDNIWYFTGRSMQCCNEDCCDDYFATPEEALQAILQYANNDRYKIRAL